MTIHEPATLLTDCMLGVLGCGFAIHLGRIAPRAGDAALWWRRSIWLMAVSAFMGGAYHGFSPDVPPAAEAVWWRLVLWVICGLGLAMGLSLVAEIVPEERRRFWTRLVKTKFAISVAAVMAVPVFLVAMVDYLIPMLAWAVFAVAKRRSWSGPLLAGVGLSILAGVVQQLQLGISAAFNHNDVFHVIQALALVAFHRAGVALSGHEKGPPVRAGL